MKIFLFLIVVLLNCKSTQDSKPIENPEDKAIIKKWIVTPDSGLNLRDAPSRKGKSIRLLPRGTMVSHKQRPENEKSDTIEDQKGKWLKVEVGNESGWVFDVYLSEPVFSPSGDKFYFTTVKHPKTGNIVKGHCKILYNETGYACTTEIRNEQTFKVINTIKEKEICCWYNNEFLVSYSIFNNDGISVYWYQVIDVNILEEKNLYENSSKNFLRPFEWRNKEYVGWVKTCIFDKCFELSRGVNEVYALFYLQKLYEGIEDKEKALIYKFPINISQDFGIKYLSPEQILKLKYPYTGNIEFSVDKRNYLLHVPTGKITEVKEK